MGKYRVVWTFWTDSEFNSEEEAVEASEYVNIEDFPYFVSQIEKVDEEEAPV